MIKSVNVFGQTTNDGEGMTASTMSFRHRRSRATKKKKKKVVSFDVLDRWML